MTERLRGVASNLGAEGSRETSEEAVQASGETRDGSTWSVGLLKCEGLRILARCLVVCYPSAGSCLAGVYRRRKASVSLRRKSLAEVGAAKISSESRPDGTTRYIPTPQRRIERCSVFLHSKDEGAEARAPRLSLLNQYACPSEGDPLLNGKNEQTNKCAGRS